MNLTIKRDHSRPSMRIRYVGNARFIGINPARVRRAAAPSSPTGAAASNRDAGHGTDTRPHLASPSPKHGSGHQDSPGTRPGTDTAHDFAEATTPQPEAGGICPATFSEDEP